MVLMRIFLCLCLASVCLAFAADDRDAKRLPDGTGKDLVARVCLQCHGAGNFRKARQNRQEWADTVADMIDRGAKGTDDEFETVLDYLSQNFGPNSKVNVNTAPLEELKSILGFTVEESKAVIAYRDANGPFTQWQDLQKVDGVDAKKIESKKDSMAF